MGCGIHTGRLGCELVFEGSVLFSVEIVKEFCNVNLDNEVHLDNQVNLDDEVGINIGDCDRGMSALHVDVEGLCVDTELVAACLGMCAETGGLDVGRGEKVREELLAIG